MTLRLRSHESPIPKRPSARIGLREISLMIWLLMVCSGDLLALRINKAYSKTLPKSIRSHVDKVFQDDVFSWLKVQWRDVDVINLFVWNNHITLWDEADKAFWLSTYIDKGENEVFIALSPEDAQTLALKVKTAVEWKFLPSHAQNYESLLTRQLGSLKQQILDGPWFDWRIETLEWIDALKTALETIRDDQWASDSSQEWEQEGSWVPDPVKYVGYVLVVIGLISAWAYWRMKWSKNELKKLQQTYEQYVAYDQRVDRVKKKAERLKSHIQKDAEYVSWEQEREIKIILDMIELVVEQQRLQREQMKEFTEEGNLIKIMNARESLEHGLEDLALHETKLDECEKNCDYYTWVLRVKNLKSIIEGKKFDFSDLEYGDLWAEDDFLEDINALSVFSDESIQTTDLMHTHLIASNTDWIYAWYDWLSWTVTDYEQVYTLRSDILSMIHDILAQHWIMQEIAMDTNNDGVITTLEKTEKLKQHMPQLKQLVESFQQTTHAIYALQQATQGFEISYTEYKQRYLRQLEEIQNRTNLYPQLANLPPRVINDSILFRGNGNARLENMYSENKKNRPLILDTMVWVDEKSWVVIEAYTEFDNAYQNYNRLVETSFMLEKKLATQSPYNQDMFSSAPGIGLLESTIHATSTVYKEVQDSINASWSPQQTENRASHHDKLSLYHKALTDKLNCIDRYYEAYKENLKKVKEIELLMKEYKSIAESIWYSTYLNDAIVTHWNFLERNTANWAVLTRLEWKVSSIKAKEEKLNDLLRDFRNHKSKVIRYYNNNSWDINSYGLTSIRMVSPNLLWDYRFKLDSIKNTIEKLDLIKSTIKSEVDNAEKERKRIREEAKQAKEDEERRKRQKTRAEQQQLSQEHQSRRTHTETSDNTWWRSGSSI